MKIINMNIIKASKLLCILLSFITTSVAAEPENSQDEFDQYDIEILIFEQSHQIGLDNEQWQKLEVDEGEADGGDGGDGDFPTKEILETVSLDDGGENVIVELPSTSLTLADTRERLNSTVDYRVLYHKAWHQTVRDKDKSTAVWIELPELEGTINLHKQRFLHFSADLSFNSLFGEVKLEQSRRLKSKELHYFDHPLFGILVRVVKIETDKS